MDAAYTLLPAFALLLLCFALHCFALLCFALLHFVVLCLLSFALGLSIDYFYFFTSPYCLLFLLLTFVVIAALLCQASLY